MATRKKAAQFMIETPVSLPAAESPAVDVWLPLEVFAPLQRLVRSAITHYAEIDHSILQIDDTALKRFEGILNAAGDDKRGGYNLRLSNLDMAGLEALSVHAEEFFGDLGGEKDLQMTPPDITALTEKLRRYRAAAFPGDVAPV